MASKPLPRALAQQAADALAAHGSQLQAAKALGIPRPTLQNRLRRAEVLGIELVPLNVGHKTSRMKARVNIPALDGCVLVTSDAHYWPGKASTAHRGALMIADLLKPFAVINNGDSFDGASNSRWPVSSFVQLKGRPSVAEEIKANTERLWDFEQLPYVKWLTWNLGNHDARFETYLAEHASVYAGVPGFTLKEHFPHWLPAWATWIGDQVVVKHRFKTGMYGAHNNALWSGRNMVTGHDHMLWVKAIRDYNGLRWGMDAGTLADVEGPMFLDYTEDNPVNWQSGFLLLHFRGGKFTGPELVHAMPDGTILFRGDKIKV